jgi:hypothetical protein
MKVLYPNHCNRTHNRYNGINQYCTNFIQIAPEPKNTLSSVTIVLSIATDSLPLQLLKFHYTDNSNLFSFSQPL